MNPKGYLVCKFALKVRQSAFAPSGGWCNAHYYIFPQRIPNQAPLLVTRSEDEEGDSEDESTEAEATDEE
jgi:hypothetical protein